MIDQFTRFVVSCSRCDYVASAMIEPVVCAHILDHVARVHHSTRVYFEPTVMTDCGIKMPATSEEPN